MRQGFYIDLKLLQEDYPEADFGFLENVKVSERFSAFKYLHGLCADFAAILSDVYGYPIETVRHCEDPDCSGRLIHAYCIGEIMGKTAYIDIRGMTTDPIVFFEEFENEVTYYDQDNLWDLEGPATVEFWENKDALFDGDYKGWTDESILAFIKAYDQYYNVDRLQIQGAGRNGSYEAIPY